MIAFWIIVAIALIVLGLFVFTQGGQNLGPAICTIGVVILLVLIVSPARARDDGRYAQSPLKQWFDSLKSGKGPCCSDADGSALSDADWEVVGQRFRVRIPRHPDKPNELEWVDVPEDAVITEPNRAGRTMVWPIWGYLGVTIRCFMPGVMI